MKAWGKYEDGVFKPAGNVILAKIGEREVRIANPTPAQLEAAGYALCDVPDGVRSWTPLAIKRTCGGLWESLKAALQEAGIYEDFVMAQELREDDEVFARGVARARELFGDEAVDAVLKRALEETLAEDE